LQQFLREYLELHGYWVLFLWTFLEGEAGLILAGFLAFEGYFNLGGVILTALAGSFFGDQFYFYIGRWKGTYLLKVFTSIARKFRKALRLIEKYGNFVAFVSRFTYGFRIVLPLILGMTTINSGRFCLLNLASAVSWSIIFSLAGYFFGVSASLFVEDMGRYEHYLMLALMTIIGVIWLFHLSHARWRRRLARRRLKRMKRKLAERGNLP
jgi:membrane protein DedA with SNARE-associated domain